MPKSLSCKECGFEFSSSEDRCSHCGRPSLFPNITDASTREESEALSKRYDAAFSHAKSNGSEKALRGFEYAVHSESHAVISRPIEEVFRLASSERELYATFYRRVAAGLRLPDGSEWDTLREVVDSKLFHFYKEGIIFAALTLDDKGLSAYGECFLILREDMIAYRATVFEENSIVFMKKRHIGVAEQLPYGHRSVWRDRGKLAVAKLHDRITVATKVSDFPALLLVNAPDSKDDQFIEVHIYGPVSVRTLQKVRVDVKPSKRGLGVRLQALKEMLAKQNIPFS
jgi:hypothetical protein